MTESFAGYARYYDLFYGDKDYRAEARYVSGLLARHDSPVRSVLELGCGTGRHAAYIAEGGVAVHGIDRSPEMVALANDRAASLAPALRERLSFSQGDARSVRLDRELDAAIALFHVVSYQTSEHDLDATLATAATHVRPGGVFLFDFWYGPAVLADPPRVRVKRVEDDVVHATRIAEPVVREDSDVVEVHYDIFVRTKATGAIRELRELHPMRYYFEPALRTKLVEHGFDRVDFYTWLTDQPPTTGAWSVVAVARRA